MLFSPGFSLTEDFPDLSTSLCVAPHAVFHTPAVKSLDNHRGIHSTGHLLMDIYVVSSFLFQWSRVTDMYQWAVGTHSYAPQAGRLSSSLARGVGLLPLEPGLPFLQPWEGK